MRRILQFGILSALGVIFSVASAQASVLWWETNDEDIEVENGDGTTTTAADLGVTDVRIRVSGGDAGDNSYLQMAYFDPNTGGLTIGDTPGTTVVEVPTYDVYAYLGPDGYNYDSAAYSFAINAITWPLAWPDVVQ